MAKRKRLSAKENPEFDDLQRRLKERIDYHTARLKERYGPDYRTAETYEEWLELREKYARIDRERERARRFRWLRALRPSRPA